MSEKVSDSGIITKLVKEGKVSPLTVEIINMEKMCEHFGWTPKEFLESDMFYLNAFKSILIGKSEGMDSKNPKK